jgi:predicted nuclease of predicted toxin-antitoxin system
VKLLLDEMLGDTVAEQLRRRGHDVTAVEATPSLRGLTDPALFEHAQGEERTLVTYNRDDYLALDRIYRDLARSHYGIVILHPRRFPQSAATTGALVSALGSLMSTGPPYPSFIHWLR